MADLSKAQKTYIAIDTQRNEGRSFSFPRMVLKHHSGWDEDLPSPTPEYIGIALDHAFAHLKSSWQEYSRTSGEVARTIKEKNYV